MKRLTAIFVFCLISVMAINIPAAKLKTNGNAGPLVIILGSAGLDPDPVSDSSTSYDINTNKDNQKITGALDTTMPANTSLGVTLSAPAAAALSIAD